MADRRAYAVTGLQIVAVALAYFASAYVVPVQQVGGFRVSMLWPPTGVGLAALLVLGLRVWPGIVLGSFLINLFLGRALAGSLALAAATALGLVCAFLLLRQVRFRAELDRQRDVIALVILGGFAGAVVIATLSVGALVLSGLESSARFWTTWFLWWLSYTTGVLVVTPFLLVVSRARWRGGVRPLRVLEAVLLGMGTVLVMLVATRGALMLLFLVSPFLCWAALRFRLAGAAVCEVIVAAMAIWASLRGVGQFARFNVVSSIITVEAFIGSTALTAFALAAATQERDRAYERLQETAGGLYSVVDQLDRRMRPRPAPKEWLRDKDRLTTDEDE